MTSPAKPAAIRLSKCAVGEAEIAAAGAALRSSFLGMGAEVRAFEEELAAYIGGSREVLCVSTGTSALHLALQACGICSGDEVLVPSLTFVASFQAISATGATPIACEVLADDGCLDPEDAARRITSRTKAIMPVHYGSGSGRLEAIYELAQQHGLRVVEDAAHAFGCRVGERRVGSFGDIVCFSFDGIKNITCGEGGAIATGDHEVAERIKNARLLGVEKDTEKRYAGQRSWEFDVTEQGWRYHLSNINAAIGREQLRRLESEFAPRRVAQARRYVEALSPLPNIRTLDLEYGRVVPHIFPVFILNHRRDAVRAACANEGIETGIHYKPGHLLSLYGGGQDRLPVAERLYEEMLSLPLHVDLTDAEQTRVIETAAAALQA
jgi:dTDP-4-amino-4,6-dideoxygalactose transaminase